VHRNRRIFILAFWPDSKVLRLSIKRGFYRVVDIRRSFCFSCLELGCWFSSIIHLFCRYFDLIDWLSRLNFKKLLLLLIHYFDLLLRCLWSHAWCLNVLLNILDGFFCNSLLRISILFVPHLRYLGLFLLYLFFPNLFLLLLTNESHLPDRSFHGLDLI